MILFIAPPGFGKTTFLLNLYQNYLDKIVFISPLRALANEFYQRAKVLGGVELISGHRETDKIVSFKRRRKSLLIATPETLSDFHIESFRSMDSLPLMVFDEFHLFYYWGDHFRPQLWESCMSVVNSELPMLGLTATMSERLFSRWNDDFIENRVLVDFGNQRFKNFPAKVEMFCSSSQMRRRLLVEMNKNSKELFIYFCKYRMEVDRLVLHYRQMGMNVVGCKGGEVAAFQKALSVNRDVQCIFSTSSLSHGVNLPQISKVFISYKVKNKDFWIQMSARGGREGGKYILYSMDNFVFSRKRYFLELIRAILLDFFIKIKLYWFGYAEKN